jgi:hypothetical protein
MLGTRPPGPRNARPDDRLRRHPPLDGNEEAGYGFAYNPTYEGFAPFGANSNSVPIRSYPTRGYNSAPV